MELKVYSVLDKAVGAFLPPFYMRSDGEAIRSFAEACNDPKSLGKHAEDFTLFRLGSFDDGSGLFKCGEPERVLSALEVRLSSDGVVVGTAGPN